MCTPWHDTDAQTELFWHIGRSSVPDLLPMGIRVALRSGRRYETLAEPHARSMVTRVPMPCLTVVARACGMCLRKDLMSLWCIKEAFVPGLETFVQV